MKETLKRLLTPKQQKIQQRLEQPIIPTEQLKTEDNGYIPLLTEQITDELCEAPNVFDYSYENLNRNIQQIQRINFIKREIELCDLLGFDWYFHTKEQDEEIDRNIKKCQSIGRIDELYCYIEQEK